MKTTTYSKIFHEGIKKESEKAICLECEVSWNCGQPKRRDIWFPKSVVKDLDEHMCDVADWFLNKVEAEGGFKGYAMIINKPVNF